VLHGEAARAKARALDGFIGQSVAVREPHDAGRRTVERLAAHYVEDHLWGLSLRFREKQTYVLVLPGSAPASSPLNPRRLRCVDRRRRDRQPRSRIWSRPSSC
jgi:hypothetical protein